MPVIRTPEEHFENLPGYDFDPNYMMVGECRVHYVDEGEGEVVLCLHGEPSWSFLYRKMIPMFAQKHRVVAPDFIGFGKSDKFTEMEEYSFQMFRDMLVEFLDTLELDGITERNRALGLLQDVMREVDATGIACQPERGDQVDLEISGIEPDRQP